MTIVTGYVRDQAGDLLADAKVRLYRRDTGALLGEGLTGDGAEAAVGDSLFSSVSVLIHGNGANGSTIFTDSSNNNRTITGSGGAVISTSVYKYGSSSISFPANGAKLSVPVATGSFNSAFCFEAWVYPTSVATNGTLYSSTGDANAPLIIYLLTDLKLRVVQPGYFGTIINSNSAVFTLNAWNHVCVERVWNTLTGYINGTPVGSRTNIEWFNTSNTPTIGTDYTGAHFRGNMADIRLTVGNYRYNGNFNPPFAEYPEAVIPAKPLGSYMLATGYSGEIQRIVCAPDGWDPIANDLIDRIILP